MYSVSDEIIEQLNNNNRQTAILTVTLASGDTLTITEANIMQGGLTIDRAGVSGSKLELGSAIAAELSLKLRNFDGEYDDITFEGAKINVQIGVLSDDETEVTYIPAGVFIVDEEPRSLSTVAVSALDRMVLFDKDVEWDSLSFPCTVSELADQVCDICGVTCATDMTTLINYSYSIPAQPTDETTTYRVLIQWIAGLTGTNAFMDWEGELVFSWYENETGITIDKTKRYSSDIYENALNITGVCYTYTETTTDSDGNETEEEITYMAGNDGYYIDLSANLLIQDEYEELLDNIYNKIFSLNYLPYEMSILPAPYFFPMDVVTITDRKGTDHSSIITNINYTLNGATVISAQGETAQSDSYSSGNGLTAEQAAAIAALRTDISAFGTVITNYMYATNATIETLNANYASIEELIATYATIEYLQTYYLTASEITATYATIETLESVTASIKDLFSDYASISYLEANYVTTGALETEIANITEAYITSAAVTELLADYATVTELNAVSATINSLSSSYAEIDFSNVNVSNVVTEFVSDLLTAQGFLASTATIDTVSVTSYLTGVGIIADYITAGTLDCTNITVANLSVGVLTVDSINGYTLAGSTVDADNLEELLTQIMDAITTTDDEVAEALEAAGLVTTEVSTLSSTVITDIEIQYYLSTSSETTIGGSWSSSAPEWTEGTYIWTRNLITYGNGSTVYSDAVCITGNSGSSGSDGVSVTSIVNYYARSTSSTEFELSYSDTSAVVDSAIAGSALTDTIAYDGWSTEVPEINETYRYLWNFEIIYYSDGSYITTDPHVVGVYGATGSDGKGISSITEYYGLSTDSDTQPDSWSTDVPTLTSINKYLWNYEVVTYTDSTTESTTPLIIGVYGDTGETGVGISEVIEYYASSSSNSTEPTEWSTTVTSISSTNKYLWNYEKVVYTDGTSVSTTPVVIGVYGDTGASGSDGADGVGISSIVEYYGLSASTSTQPSEWLTSPPVLTSTNKYLWNYETVIYSDGTTSSTEPAIIGVYGDTGASGSDGVSGSDGSDGVGVKSITNYYLLSTSNTDYESEYSTSSALVDYAIVDSAAADYTDWSTTVPTMTAEYKYLWCYTVIEYTDGSTSVCEPYVLGAYGDTGEDGADGQMLYATCSTAASTAAKVATLVSGDLELTSGSTVTVTFTYANTAASPTLNIESTGAKTIYISGAVVSSSNEYYWEAGSTITFVYDGSHWVVSDAGATAAIATVTSIASGKSTTYFSDTAPSSSDFDLQENDVWFDTDDDNAMYMWDGTAWEKCEYGTSAIAASAITAELIAAEAITTAKIAAGAVTSNEIAANTITAANILAGTITASEIDTDSIATAVLSATYIQASTLSIGSDSDGNVIISNGKITADMIDAETITGDMIVSESITATQIAAGTITSNEIDVSSITAAILTAGSITATMIASGAVTADKISVSDLSALGATIGGFTIGTTALYSNADTYEGANNVYLGMNGISLGDTFSVDSTGNLSATQGTIGAITLSSTGLYACNMSEESGVVGVGTADYAVADTITADNYAGIYKPSTISSSSIAFFAGATSAAGASAVFSVTYGGALTATSATIEGSITATSGTIGGFNIGSDSIYTNYDSYAAYNSNIYIGSSGISLGKTFAVTYGGALTATSGTIGAITIGSYGLYAYNSSYSSSYAGIYRPSTITTSSKAFFAGSTSYTGASAAFYVTYGGSLTATDATLTGSITSKSGYYKAILTSGNLDFYYDDDQMMSYGSTADSSDSSVRGARFGMTYDCDFMSFSRKLTSTTSNYTSWLAYSYTGDFTGYADTAYFNCAIKAPYFIKSGTIERSDLEEDTTYSGTITFGTSFAGTPIVFAAARTSYPHLVHAGVRSPSSTGFTYYVRRESGAGTSDTNIDWIAIYNPS